MAVSEGRAAPDPGRLQFQRAGSHRLPASSQPFAGAQVFVERAGGALELLLLAEGLGPSEGRCVSWGPREGRALFLQAPRHRDISRRVASRFELSEDRCPELPPQAHGLGADGE